MTKHAPQEPAPADFLVVSDDRPGPSRRSVLRGAVGVGAVIVAGGVIDLSARDKALAAPDPGNTTVPLPTTTEPEQLHLTWGADPKTQVTVSWAAPGTVKQPAPSLVFSDRPLSGENRGHVIRLPEPEPLNQKETLVGPRSVSFTDGLSGFTTYHYHVPLDGLSPDTTYYYQVTDGAGTPSVAGGNFTTAPAGRAKFRFSSYGDLGTPTSESPVNVTGFTWGAEGSNDTCVFEVDSTITASDGGPAPLFHLLNGDLCYADGAPANTPSVWRDFSVNVSRSAAFRPWMPTLGNHEYELGATAKDGSASSTEFWNGAYGSGNYHARFLLPDNGLTNYDGNRLRGMFYSFQIGTVLFVAVDADDVVLVGAGGRSGGSPVTYNSGITVPAGVDNATFEYTGDLAFKEKDVSLVPTGPQPNLQGLWLEKTLREGRSNPSVDMIVVWIHHPPIAASETGSDMGIRAAWVQLFDDHEVDLVLCGHNHCYERTYPLRGFDPPSGTVTEAFTSSLDGKTYEVGDTIDTRRPTVVTTTPKTVGGVPAFNTARGTTYLTMGGGGASAANVFATDPVTGLPRATVYVTTGGADAVEDAPWSAARDATDAHGYSYFDVDPGERPGETTITFQWFQIPTVAPGTSITLPTTPYEKFVFGRHV